MKHDYEFVFILLLNLLQKTVSPPPKGQQILLLIILNKSRFENKSLMPFNRSLHIFGLKL